MADIPFAYPRLSPSRRRGDGNAKYAVFKHFTYTMHQLEYHQRRSPTPPPPQEQQREQHGASADPNANANANANANDDLNAQPIHVHDEAFRSAFSDDENGTLVERRHRRRLRSGPMATLLAPVLPRPTNLCIPEHQLRRTHKRNHRLGRPRVVPHRDTGDVDSAMRSARPDDVAPLRVRAPQQAPLLPRRRSTSETGSSSGNAAGDENAPPDPSNNVNANANGDGRDANASGSPGSDRVVPALRRPLVELHRSEAWKEEQRHGLAEVRQTNDQPPDYVPIKLLGRGGYGSATLWRRKDFRAGATAAVDPSRQFPPYMVVKQCHGRSLEELRNESRLYTYLGNRHAHLVKLLRPYHEDVQRVDGRFVRDAGLDSDTGLPHPGGNRVAKIYLEFAERGDMYDGLQSILRTGKVLKEESLWRIFECLAKGLLVLEYGTEDIEEARAIKEGRAEKILPRSVVHCDLKPANVLVASANASHPDNDRYMIADLGIAFLEPEGAGIDDPDYRAYVQGRGTRGYKAPEVVHNYPDNLPPGQWPHHSGPMSKAMDVYPIGCIMFEYAMRGTCAVPDRLGFQAEFPGYGPLWTQGHQLLDKADEYTDCLVFTILRCLAYFPDQRPTALELAELARDAMDNPHELRNRSGRHTIDLSTVRRVYRNPLLRELQLYRPKYRGYPRRRRRSIELIPAHLKPRDDPPGMLYPNPAHLAPNSNNSLADLYSPGYETPVVDAPDVLYDPAHSGIPCGSVDVEEEEDDGGNPPSA